MFKFFAFASLVVAGCFFSSSLPSASSAAAPYQSSATVSVDCTKNHSINKALEKHPNSPTLIVEINGICHENVVVTRDRVTLRGDDPATDGVDAVNDLLFTDAAVLVREAHTVILENLKLTGGTSGLAAVNAAAPPGVVFNNCRFEGNRVGATLLGSAASGQNNVFGPNQFTNLSVTAGTRFFCSSCTFTSPGTSVPATANKVNISVADARMNLLNSTLTGGGITSDGGFVGVSDSTIENEDFLSISANGDTIVNLSRVHLTGFMTFNQASSAQLGGVTQDPLTLPDVNSVGLSAFVRIGDAPPPPPMMGPPIISSVQGFVLSNFSNLSLNQNSMINGNLSCGSGSNAFCTNPANVTGVSTCALCP